MTECVANSANPHINNKVQNYIRQLELYRNH